MLSVSSIASQKLAMAHLAETRCQRESISELRARSKSGKKIHQVSRSNDPSPAQAFASPLADNSIPVEGGNDGYEEEGGEFLVLMRGEGGLDHVLTYRERSRSAWLHFPHVELLFLLFAFEGSVASQAANIQSAACPEVFYAAVAALVSNT